MGIAAVPFISLQCKTEIAGTLASSAPGCLGEKGGSDSSQERQSQVKAALSLRRAWMLSLAGSGKQRDEPLCPGKCSRAQSDCFSLPFALPEPSCWRPFSSVQTPSCPCCSPAVGPREGSQRALPMPGWCRLSPWCLVSGKGRGCPSQPWRAPSRMRKCPVAQLPSIRLFALFSRSAELHVGK